MSYTKTTWNDGDVITKEKMNNLETGVETANGFVGLTGTATTITPIAEPSTETSENIATKVNEIITQLQARGVIS